MIDKSGQWWTGSAFDDLVTYLRELTADSYPAGPVVPSTCDCGAQVFTLEADADEGCARRTCTSCGRVALIADSADYWDDAEPDVVQCPCGDDAFELGVAFALREDRDVRWITVGVRCVACGVLGAPVDWKVDYSPTDHLLSAA